MGVTAREQQIIDLYDAGKSSEQIAETMGVKTSYVVQRLGFLSGSRAEDRVREAAIAAGSAALLASLKREGLAAK